MRREEKSDFWLISILWSESVMLRAKHCGMWFGVNILEVIVRVYIYIYFFFFSVFRISPTVQSLVTRLANSNVACVAGSFVSTAKHLQRSSKYIAIARDCKLS